MVTKATPPSFTKEQDVLLLEFLGKAEKWVQNFTWDLSDKTERALYESNERLDEQRRKIALGLEQKPARAIANELAKQERALDAASQALAVLEPGVRDKQTELAGYELAVVLQSDSRSKSTRGGKHADIRLEVRVPAQVTVSVGGYVSVPFEVVRQTSKHVGESDDAFEARLAIEATERVAALGNPDKWQVIAPERCPKLEVSRYPQYWYLIIAPKSEGLMSSFQRLQLIRSLAGNLAAYRFGVVTDNEKLSELAEAQEYMSFLCKQSSA